AAGHGNESRARENGIRSPARAALRCVVHGRRRHPGPPCGRPDLRRRRSGAAAWRCHFWPFGRCLSQEKRPAARHFSSVSAGDLALWHWSLILTSVAASTLEASLAPLFVTFLAWLLWRERPTVRFLAATGCALSGMVLIVSPKFGHGSSALLGDVLGLATAVFYAGYIVVVARLRARYGTGLILFNSTLVYTVLLLPLAL